MKQRIFLHVAFWLAFGLYDGYLNAPLAGSSYEHLSLGERLLRGYLAEVIVLLYKIPTTYLVLYWLVPRYFRTKNLPVFVGAVVGLTVLVTILSKVVWFQIIFPHIYEVSNPEPVASIARKLLRWLWNMVDILLLLGVTSAIKFFRLSQNAAEREHQLVQEKLQSELNFLRSQTNPHFLFNTLNNLYHLARKRSDTTPDAILKLSDLLRFMLYECTASSIPIHRELKVIRDYLELEKLRYGDRLLIDFNVDVDDENQPIAPLLMLPFIENAFKHGASESRGETWVRIQLMLENGQLDLFVDNPKEAASTAETMGIGLKNVKRQLEMLYPSHVLHIDNQKDMYKVHLHLPLSSLTGIDSSIPREAKKGLI